MAAYISSGHLVVIPTDTLYGLGCNAFDDAAIRQLFRVKQRPLHKAIPILLADPSDLHKVVAYVPPIAQNFISQHWPGALTLILPKAPHLPPTLSPDDTVAVRIPDHETARAVIRAAGGALAITSANLSGQAPAQTAGQALACLHGLVTAVLDAGPTTTDLASTVLDCTGREPVVLRQGPVII